MTTAYRDYTRAYLIGRTLCGLARRQAFALELRDHVLPRTVIYANSFQVGQLAALHAVLLSARSWKVSLRPGKNLLTEAMRPRYIEWVHDLRGGAVCGAKGICGASIADGGSVRQVDFTRGAQSLGTLTLTLCRNVRSSGEWERLVWHIAD